MNLVSLTIFYWYCVHRVQIFRIIVGNPQWLTIILFSTQVLDYKCYFQLSNHPENIILGRWFHTMLLFDQVNLKGFLSIIIKWFLLKMHHISFQRLQKSSHIITCTLQCVMKTISTNALSQNISPYTQH